MYPNPAQLLLAGDIEETLVRAMTQLCSSTPVDVPRPCTQLLLAG